MKSHVFAVYRQHIADVIALVPEQRLLHYEVSAGWGPLCRFLGIAEPDTLFPHRSTRADFLASAPAWARPFMNQHPDDEP